MEKYVFLVLVFVIGIILGIIIKNVYTSIKLSKAKDEAKKIVDDANAKADNIIKEANLDAKT